MLDELFGERSDSVRFVRFDALKYAETPLRRQFLLKLSKELETSPPELYSAKTANDFELQPGKVLKILGLFLASVVFLMTVVVIGAAAYGLLAAGPGAARFRDALEWAAPKVFVPGALLSAFAALLGNQFKLETKVDAPNSDEQFESAFEDLVREAIGIATAPGCPAKIDDRKKRLVVFIDELDRCSPTEVATVLETLRTFLEVKGCVFIVAADQHALEEALSRRVKQATPSNAVTPYYSAGSAYLDKIFQYQLSLPPLKPQRLTRFALDLLESKSGVWERVQTAAVLEDVISVLIPTHVDSPRRVKVLLNNFALLYRVAEHRASQDKLHPPDISSRATELAKLACLRMEFPLFAADFALDARMPELVRRAADNEELPKYLRTEVEKRVKSWAAKELAVDELLIYSSREDEAARAAGRHEASSSRKEVQEEHAEQLLRYLRKTAQIPGPGRDLIHLESAAAAIGGIDPASADDIERAAVDGETEVVRDLVGALEGDAQRAAILLLSHIVSQSAVGVEGDNAVRTLIAALQVRTVELGEAADRTAVAIAAHRYELRDGDLLAALELAEQCSHAAGRTLRARVLASNAVLSDIRLQLAVLRVADKVAKEDPSRLAAVAAAAVVVSGSKFAESLLRMDDQVALLVIDGVGRELDLTDSSIADVNENRIDQLAEALHVLSGESGDRSLADRLAAVIVETEIDEVVDAVHEQLGRMTATSDPRFAKAAIGCVSSRPLEEVSDWLAVVPPTGMSAVNAGELKALLGERIAEQWRDHVAGGADADDMLHLAESLRPFVGGSMMPDGDVIPEDVLETLGGAVASDDAAAARVKQLSVAEHYSKLGLFAGVQIADLALRSVAGSVSAGYGPQAQSGLVALLLDYSPAGSRAAIAQARDALAAAGSIWPGEVEGWVVILSSQLDGADSTLPYDVSQIRSLVEHHGAVFQRGLVSWISEYARDADELFHCLGPLLGAPPPPEVADVVAKEIEKWRSRPGDERQHRSFTTLLAACIGRGEFVDRNWFKAARADLVGDALTHQLGDIYEAGADATRVRQILDVWEVMHVTDNSQVRAFCRRVFVPVARSHDASVYGVAKDFIHLLARLPEDRRRAIRDLMRLHARQFNDEADFEERLERAGLKKRSVLRGKRDR